VSRIEFHAELTKILEGSNPSISFSVLKEEKTEYKRYINSVRGKKKWQKRKE
jgi:hypothetical protein